MKFNFKISLLVLFISVTTTCIASTYVIAESNGDFTKIQNALNIAVAGDTILVREKSAPYFEKITFQSSGDSINGFIILAAYPGEHPIIDGSNYSAGGDWPHGLIRIINRNYIKVIGFEIRNLITSNSNLFPAGIWVRGSSHHIEILNNKIYNIEQNANNAGAHGIAVYGTHGSIPISNLVIDGNEIYNCKLGWSESLVLNGNVENFIVSNNVVHDNNNIAYDFIGHEGESPNPELDQARNGLVVGNIAYNIDSRGNQAYGNEASANGFYVDGGKDIIFERNIAYNCNIGFEIASEHGGKSTSGIIIRNNLIRENIVVGLAIGGYDSQRGSADDCYIINNTFYKNNTENYGWGAEILLQYYCENNLFANNIVYSNSNIPLLEHKTNTGTNNTFNNNLYFTDGNAVWQWEANSYTDFENYKTGSGQEDSSIFANPLLVNPSNNNPGIEDNSPVIDNGRTIDEAIVGKFDFFENSRIINLRIDIGAVEFDGTTSVKALNNKIKNSFHLFQNYPNPFNPNSIIKYTLPMNKNQSSIKVKLKIYDILGKEVKTLVNQAQKPGTYEIKFDASELISGVYYYRLISENFIKTKKLILLK